MQNRIIPNGVTVKMGANQPEYETLMLRLTHNPQYSCNEFTGAFYPSAEELELLNKGHPILLSQLGGWRPMMLEVAHSADGSDG